MAKNKPDSLFHSCTTEALLTQIEDSCHDLRDPGEEGERERLDDARAGVVVGHEGVDGRGAHRGLLARAEDRVDEAREDGGVEAVLE